MDSESFIRGLGPELAPLSNLLARTSHDMTVSGADLLVSHRPLIGAEAYAITLHSPLSGEDIDSYAQSTGLVVSPHYIPVLRSINGGHIFELSLYGAPRSMIGNPPLLDRSSRQPLDLATANRFWRSEYKASPDLFHFGGGSYSLDENVGYFLDTSGAVQALRKSGEIWRSWPSFGEFLSAELDRLEKAFPAFEAFMADIPRPAR
jgi:hypothetical protein